MIFLFVQGLEDEVRKHKEILAKIKDYDANLAKEKVVRAYQEKEKRRLEVKLALKVKIVCILRKNPGDEMGHFKIIP